MRWRRRRGASSSPRATWRWRPRRPGSRPPAGAAGGFFPPPPRAAGCQLVATCDLAVAAESAGFALPGGKGGLFCHTPLVAVARTIGRKRALEMALTGDVVDASTAADWGLVNRVVPAAELDDATWDLVARATRGSAHSKALGKQGFYAQVGLDQDAAYRQAITLMAAAAVTADAQEGIAAFLAKRPAR